jgi:diaminopimelate epimerase
VRHRLVPEPVATVHLPGGTVEVRQDGSRHVWLRGPAAIVAEGRLASELLST